jgi:putative flippase GtrA
MSLADSHGPIARQFVAFAAIGVVGFAIDAGVLYLLLTLTHIGFYLGRLASFLCAATVTWYLNRTFTFPEVARQSGLDREWLRFLGANSIGGLVNVGVYALLVWKLAFFAALPVLAVAAGSLSGLTVNFTLTRAYVFKAERTAL